MLESLFRKKSITALHNEIQNSHEHSLHKVLTVRDLTAFGIAAIIGAGIFSTIGTASAEGGPGVIFLFIFTAIACSFAAFCYAEFASMIPVSGSAYTYSYVAFGELFAWIIGWALIMEYAIGNITVAISWSDYFCGLLQSMGINLPQWMQMDLLSAKNGFDEASKLMQAGKGFNNLDANLQSAYYAYSMSPKLGGFHFVADLPALLIIILITALVYRGIKESRNASNFMVIVKVSVVILVIVVGAFYVDATLWNPFMPNGVPGILKGVSAVFFAYIGFDAISTTAEECKDPQRDLPRSMMYSIIICTILYVLIALVLTGMVSYKELAVGDPLAFVFSKINLNWISGIIAVSAIFAMASVLLVFQLGQPRIWMSMSRDGLLPKAFSNIHPRFKTPSFATIITGLLVAIPALFLNLTTVTNLCSIGTLFAFVLVCGGVLMLRNNSEGPKSKFKTPYFNAKYIVPLGILLIFISLYTFNKSSFISFVTNAPQVIPPSELVSHLPEQQLDDLKNHVMYYEPKNFTKAGSDIDHYLQTLDYESYEKLLNNLPFSQSQKYISSWNGFKDKIPMWIFILVGITMGILGFIYNLSLIPILGVLSCLYMMAQIPVSNWIGFMIWLFTGLIIYFSYSIKHSKLRKPNVVID